MDYLNKIIIPSLKLLLESDISLIRRRLKEECINHQLAIHIMRKLPSNRRWLNVDLEYDKNYEKPKIVTDDLGNRYKIRPDIIIHARENNLNNKVALECKKGYLEPSDKRKLKSLRKDPYKYDEVYGVSYLPDKKYCLVYIFEDNTIYHRMRIDK